MQNGSRLTDAPPDTPSWLRWAIYVIQTVGFPVVVAAYLLWQQSTILSPLSEQIAANTLAVQRLVQVLTH